MKYTEHANVRMGQRGIAGRMVDLALTRGRIDGDRRVLDLREVRAQLERLNAERAAFMKVLDKGGLAVTVVGDTVITAFNIEKGRIHV